MNHRKIYHYNPKLKERARQLRNNSTLSEVLLWNELKNGKMKGKDFHRQKPIMSFIVDFFCPELALAIEIDGNSHDSENAYEKDMERQREMEGLGIQFLRFNDLDVKRNMPGVLSIIEQWVEKHTPDPSQEGN
ncbi:MAG: endonuclease domain-containing protein [Pseudomonadota bacterium]